MKAIPRDMLDICREFEDEYPEVIHDVKLVTGASSCLSAACLRVGEIKSIMNYCHHHACDTHPVWPEDIEASAKEYIDHLCDAI
ncbi:hypothetical protein BDB01DRAFT_848891 [Pilobolus umbonatus]|nr:hypothetical protein BDB01DRAFT_848891 [Pilobolus umbonatus]